MPIPKEPGVTSTKTSTPVYFSPTMDPYYQKMTSTPTYRPASKPTIVWVPQMINIGEEGGGGEPTLPTIRPRIPTTTPTITPTPTPTRTPTRTIMPTATPTATTTPTVYYGAYGNPYEQQRAASDWWKSVSDWWKSETEKSKRNYLAQYGIPLPEDQEKAKMKWRGEMVGGKGHSYEGATEIPKTKGVNEKFVSEMVRQWEMYDLLDKARRGELPTLTTEEETYPNYSGVLYYPYPMYWGGGYGGGGGSYNVSYNFPSSYGGGGGYTYPVDFYFRRLNWRI